MEDLINAIITKLSTTSLKYAAEDWGQLDYFTPNFPVKFPCALVDISAANFENLGRDKTDTPINRQIAETRISITVANLRLTNSSAMATQIQKDNAFSIWNLQQEIHEILHGWKPTPKTGAMMRSGMQRIKRDDGVQEYILVYDLGMTNV